jgi:hypothetical protein
MEAKAARNLGAITHRPSTFFERLAAFLPRMEPEANGNGRAASNRKVKGSDAGARLESYLRGSEATILHQLKLPGSRGEIDYLVVGPAGVTVVDCRHYREGKAKFANGRLRIGGRDRTALIGEILDQAEAVRDLLADSHFADVPVDAAIAVGQAGGVPSVSTRDCRRVIVWGTGLIAREASRPGPLSPRRVSNLATRLAAELQA